MKATTNNPDQENIIFKTSERTNKEIYILKTKDDKGYKYIICSNTSKNQNTMK
jgi:hypothetical protein